MDERLQKALEFSNYQKTLELKKETLKLKCEHSLIINYKNNIFKVTKELITFINLFKNDEFLILEDSSGVPVRIVDPKSFYDTITSTYKTAYLNYYQEYEKLKKARNISKVVS